MGAGGGESEGEGENESVNSVGMVGDQTASKGGLTCGI